VRFEDFKNPQGGTPVIIVPFRAGGLIMTLECLHATPSTGLEGNPLEGDSFKRDVLLEHDRRRAIIG